MGLYVDRDIQTSFDGDLEIDSKGDLKLANSLDTYKGAVNFILRTDFGDYAPTPTVGSNLGSFIGESNTKSVHSKMENTIARAIAGPILNDSDVSIKVVPLDVDEAVCFIFLAGKFLIDEKITWVQEDRIAYTFPYIDGTPTPLTI